MGYWTTKSGKRHNVNLDDGLIKAMQKAGARFCWMNDTPGIADENNETFYETDTHRVHRMGITVTAENGEKITGYISHWVPNYNNNTSATNINKWFIFQQGTYPTPYIIKRRDVVITDL